MTQGIKDKVVVITGASSGLGEATARHLTAEGGSVVLGARRLDRLQALAKYINGRGGKALAVVTDVTQRDQVERLVDTAVKTYGRIDVIINNAGLMPQSLLEHLKVDEWDRMIDVNIKGVLYGIAAALPHMQRQKSGHIINVSSVAGHKVGPGSAVYAATKHAVRALSEGLRQEVKPYNIRTTVISPGAVATETLFELLHETAEREQIPFTVEATARSTGTDADAVHISRAGVPTGLVSIPIRYMHSPVELVQLEDVHACARLIAAAALRLEGDATFSR